MRQDKRADDTRNTPRVRKNCPAPHKVGFRSEDVALRRAMRLAKKNPCRVYRCDCGRWHLTSWSLEKWEAYRDRHNQDQTSSD